MADDIAVPAQKDLPDTGAGRIREGGISVPAEHTHFDSFHSIQDGEFREYILKDLNGSKVTIHNPDEAALSVAFDQHDKNEGRLRVRSRVDNQIHVHLFRHDDHENGLVHISARNHHG